MSKNRSKKTRLTQGGRWRRGYITRNLNRYVGVKDGGIIEWIKKGPSKGYFVVEMMPPREQNSSWIPLHAQEERIGPFDEFAAAEACMMVRRGAQNAG